MPTETFDNKPVSSISGSSRSLTSELPFHLRPLGKEPEVTVTEQKLGQIIKIVELLVAYKLARPLLHEHNGVKENRDHAGLLVYDELKEAVEELERVGPVEQILPKFLMELIDTLAIPVGIAEHQGLGLNYVDIVSQVNGQAKKTSGIYDQAGEIAANFSHNVDQLAKDIRMFCIYIFSAFKHAPPAEVDLLLLSLKKNALNAVNYPAELFTKYDLQGNALDQEEIKSKYTHVYKCLRWLRGLYQPDRMLPADWHQVQWLIEDFRNGDQNFSELQRTWFKSHPELLKIATPAAASHSVGAQLP